MGNHKNSQFWPILACFVWYYSLILVAAAIRMFWEPRDPVTGNSSKLAVLAYSAEFCKNYSLILRPAAIRTFWEPWGPVTGNSSKLAVLAYSGQFCMLLVTDFGSRCHPNVSGTPGSGEGEIMKTRSFGLFRPVLYAITQ